MLPDIPVAFRDLHAKSRYKVFYGGRGSAKSWSIARVLVSLAARKKLRVICAREYQISIEDSVHKLLVDQIHALGLTPFYRITDRTITCTTTGSSFRFVGLKTNIRNIKGLEGADIVWVEEAECVSAASWNILIPTVRKKGSEIWVSFNPDQESDPTYQRFVKHPPPNAIVRMVSWRDNPHFTEELRAEKDHLQRVDPDAFEWVWEGSFRISSAAQILSGKWRRGELKIPEDAAGPYHGTDFGYASDPTTIVRCWIIGAGKGTQGTLYIEREFGRVKLEVSETAPAFRQKIPDLGNRIIYADSARPETISHCCGAGLNMVAADKWSGSVEDGIAFLRGFEEIVIRPECKGTIQEAQLYSYKTDKLTGDVLPDIVDKHNHYIDAVRYALSKIIKRSGPGMGFLQYAAEQLAQHQEKGHP